MIDQFDPHRVENITADGLQEMEEIERVKIPMKRWGKDHWALLAYLDAVCVDHGGRIDVKRITTNADRHPSLAWHRSAFTEPFKYHLRIKDGQQEYHDEWDALQDLVDHGLVELLDDFKPSVRGMAGFGFRHIAQPRVALTPKGFTLAHKLREHKAAGGSFATFEPKVRPRGR